MGLATDWCQSSPTQAELLKTVYETLLI